MKILPQQYNHNTLTHKLKIFYILVLCIFFIIIPQINSTKLDFNPKLKQRFKNILLKVFIAAPSHHFFFRKLLTHSQKIHPEYNFTLIIHNVDKPHWENSQFKDNIIYYGDHNMKDLIVKAIRSTTEDPIFGYQDFHKAILEINRQLIESQIVPKLLKDMKFEMVIGDLMNYYLKYLIYELQPNSVVLSIPYCQYCMVYGAYEFNTAITPMMGVTFTDRMTFSQRLFNFAFSHGQRAFFSIMGIDHLNVFRDRGSSLKGHEYLFNPDFFLLSQCGSGVHYALPKPPNFVELGTVLGDFPQPITDKTILDFFDKFDTIVYFSPGTFYSKLTPLELMQLFNHFTNVGFLLSFNLELEKTVDFPQNILFMKWVPQNDILGHEKVKAFISHGGNNSVLESLLHGVPLISIGISIDHITLSVFVGDRDYGKSITRIEDYTSENIIQYLEEILTDDKYRKNCLEVSRYMKMNHRSVEIWDYWVDYVMKFGYDDLIIKAYEEYSIYQLYQFDLILFYLIMIWILWSLFCKLFVRSSK